MNITFSFGTAMATVAASALAMAAPSRAMATVVTPPASFVTADIPGSVSNKSGTRDTIVGDIHHTTMAGDAGDAELSITATMLPGFVTAVATDGTLLRKARRELLKNYGGSRSSWTKCTFKGSACRKMTYRTKDGRKGQARLMLKGDTLVVLNAVYEKDASAAKKFLESAN